MINLKLVSSPLFSCLYVFPFPKTHWNLHPKTTPLSGKMQSLCRTELYLLWLKNLTPLNRKKRLFRTERKPTEKKQLQPFGFFTIEKKTAGSYLPDNFLRVLWPNKGWWVSENVTRSLTQRLESTVTFEWGNKRSLVTLNHRRYLPWNPALPLLAPRRLYTPVN